MRWLAVLAALACVAASGSCTREESEQFDRACSLAALACQPQQLVGWFRCMDIEQFYYPRCSDLGVPRDEYPCGCTGDPLLFMERPVVKEEQFGGG